MLNELLSVCCRRNPKPAEQRKQIIELVKSGIDIHETDKNGVTALLHAVRFRNPAAVRALIELGADVNHACRRNGSTPLHRAVTQTGAPGTAGKSAEAQEIVKLLLAAGADAVIKNKAGRTAENYVKDDEIKAMLNDN